MPKKPKARKNPFKEQQTKLDDAIQQRIYYERINHEQRKEIELLKANITKLERDIQWQRQMMQSLVTAIEYKAKW